MQKGNKKIINGWAFYDWANSVYPLVITSTIFPIYYEEITKSPHSDIVSFMGIQYVNTALYNYAISFAYLMIAFVSPFLSGIADYSGSKKKFMQFFCYFGSVSCIFMFFFQAHNLWLGILTIIFACIGYSGSIVFYNAYLPEIAEPNQQDEVSAKGFSLGYIGSAILLIIILVIISYPHFFGMQNNTMPVRFSFLLVGLWWIGFSQITFSRLPHNVYNRNPEGNLFFKGYNELKKVWMELKNSKVLKRFLIAFFVYNMGVQTVMLVAVLFGKKIIQMKSDELIITILIIQFVAIIGAYLFAYLSATKNNLFALKIATLIWIGVCSAAYFVETPKHFYILAFIVGLVMGGIQSLSRSTYSKLLPDTLDHASYFSFYDICEKIGIVLGLGLYGIIEEKTGNMRNAIIALLMFFVVGFFLLMKIPKKSMHQLILQKNVN